MNELQSVLLRKMLVILHRGFVEARTLARRESQQQLLDLADTFEILPQMMNHWEEKNAEAIRGILVEYQQKYPNSASNYLAIFDMDDAEFEEVFGLKPTGSVFQ